MRRACQQWVVISIEAAEALLCVFRDTKPMRPGPWLSEVRVLFEVRGLRDECILLPFEIPACVLRLPVNSPPVKLVKVLLRLPGNFPLGESVNVLLRLLEGSPLGE